MKRDTHKKHYHQFGDKSKHQIGYLFFVVKYSKVLIKNIETLMAKAGWKQAELARQLGWPAQNLNRYLTGDREPELDKIAEIASAFGVSVSDLLKTEETPKPHIERVGLADEIRQAIREEIHAVLSTEDIRKQAHGIVDRTIDRVQAAREKLREQIASQKTRGPSEPHALPELPPVMDEIISMLPNVPAGRLESLRNSVKRMVVEKEDHARSKKARQGN